MKYYLLIIGLICLLAACNRSDELANVVPTVTPPSALVTVVSTPTLIPTPKPTEQQMVPPSERTPIVIPPSADVRTPITTELMLSHVPLLNETADLLLTISTTVDVEMVEGTFELPDSAELVAGSLEWSGPLTVDQPQELQATIRFIEAGNQTIRARALSPQEGGDIWGDSNTLYLFTSEAEGHVGFENSGSSEEEAPIEDASSP